VDRKKLLGNVAFLSLNAHFFFAVALAGDCPITRGASSKQLQGPLVAGTELIWLDGGTQMDFSTG
jgi:hypothetical protein